MTFGLAVFFLVLDVDVIVVLVVVAGDVVVIVVAANMEEKEKDNAQRGGKEVGDVVVDEEEVELGLFVGLQREGRLRREAFDWLMVCCREKSVGGVQCGTRARG